jgi:imidazolonepropionase
MKKLFINIKYLINVRTQNVLLRGSQLANLPIINNAFLLIEADTIIGFGKMEDITELVKNLNEIETLDVAGASILPTWCDSHTHIVFAATREDEFVDKINGLSYAQIAAKGGGILNSAQKIESISEEELYKTSFDRLNQLIQLGTGAIEIKSGYGLSVAGEIKMLRVIKKIKETANIPVKATFLGAHTYPLKYKQDHEGYINLIINEMLPIIANENLADYIDVFCEEGFFSVDETKTICEAGKRYGLQSKIHANQLSVNGGVELGVSLQAISVDHLETINDAAIAALANSNTIGTLLPTAAFFLRMNYQPARQLIDAGCAIALASDYNPGSSPSGNMNFVNAISCIQLKMLPNEVINASTINGAFAMGLENEVGSITIGKKANFIVTKPIPSIAFLMYSFGTNLIEKVYINGK